MSENKPQVENNLFEELRKQIKKSNKKFVKIVPKIFMIVAFCLGGKKIYENYKTSHTLPYNDGQEIPNIDDNMTEQELNLAIGVYTNLINLIIQDAKKLGFNIDSGSIIKFLFYDEMTSTIDIVLQNKEQFYHLKYVGKDTKLTEDTLLNQLSQLYVIIKNAYLNEIPKQNDFSSNLSNILNTNSSTDVEYYAQSETQFSDGNSREEMQNSGIISGRDYYYFNVYGTTEKDDIMYNVVTNIAIKSDDYEILGITDLQDYYKKNSTNSCFVVNSLYQEKIEFLELLNNKISSELQK